MNIGCTPVRRGGVTQTRWADSSLAGSQSARIGAK